MNQILFKIQKNVTTLNQLYILLSAKIGFLNTLVAMALSFE